MKSIFAFQDFRDYLAHCHDEKKTETPTFSLAKLAKKAGFNSPAQLRLAIEGKRSLTISNIHALASTFSLTFDEQSYFEALVLAQQSKTKTERAFYRKRSELLRTNKPKANALKIRPNEALLRWYFPAILVALHGKKRSVSPKEIARLAGVSTAEAQTVIKAILMKGLLQFEDGHYKLDFNHVVWQDQKLSNEHERKFLKEQLERSLNSFDQTQGRSANFLAHSFTMGRDSFDYFSARINELCQELVAIADREPVEQVVQLNVQFFQLSRQRNK